MTPNVGGAHVPLGPGREFDVVRALLARWGGRAVGIGDDAAVFDVLPGHRLVVSTDTSVDRVHFRREWLSPREIGWRATMAALSDLAAMAASPLGMVVALVLPPSDTELAMELADGIGDAAEAANTPIMGGDLSHGETLTIGVTVFGSSPTPIGRHGARPGDLLFVTGALGGPGAALRSWMTGGTPADALRARFAHPVARLAEARWLADHGARALIDISDGLASEARHLAAASDVEVEVDLDKVPVLSGISARDAALSGEEYELLVAVPSPLDAAAFSRRFNLSLTHVGQVRSRNAAATARFLQQGNCVDLAMGYEHFSS
ncbi:MAG: thiamine-phosphate kinase [Gemmatimonadaceae bacterium]